LPRSASKRLIDWYRANKRDLPWLNSCDPYAVLVSEVMLQQTQVATVLPYYARFMSLFPTVESLAFASEQDAMAAWAGLGYYRRLRSLQSAARFVCDHGWPSNLRSLPGVGEYTAAALGSIAFGNQVACADGNVRRVMSRVAGKTLSLAESQRLSQEMMASHSASEWNQAVMELGALVCNRIPNCGLCPIAADCVAKVQGTACELPFISKGDTVEIEHVCACFVAKGQIALRKAMPGEWWQGLLVFPYSQVNDGESAEAAAERLGMDKPVSIGTVKHTVTKHRVTLTAFKGIGSPAGVDWYHLSRLQELPLPAPQRRVARLLEYAA
jgi:A/G-specific adenine glycosylase